LLPTVEVHLACVSPTGAQACPAVWQPAQQIGLSPRRAADPVVALLVLAPAIVFGYGVKAADAEDRGEEFGY